MSEERQHVRLRRNALRISQELLAREAGVNRDTVGAIESGLGFRRSSLTKIEEALDRIEEEAGIHAPPAKQGGEPRLFTFKVTDPEGMTIIAEGPVEDADELKRQVVDIMREIRRSAPAANGESS
jgi:DNA-binding XRE family transcriptional regulator